MTQRRQHHFLGFTQHVRCFDKSQLKIINIVRQEEWSTFLFRYLWFSVEAKCQGPTATLLLLRVPLVLIQVKSFLDCRSQKRIAKLLSLPLAHLDRVNAVVGGDLLERLAATDRLHSDPGLELGAVGVELAHRWEPLSGAANNGTCPEQQVHLNGK